MKSAALGALLILLAFLTAQAQSPQSSQQARPALSGKSPVPPNPDIDYPQFAAQVGRVGPIREARRVSVADFARMATEPGTIVLDARSAENFRRVHLKGAVNLSLPDFTAETLARLIPSKTTRVLIYCNNNFRGAPGAMASKMVTASLNLYTFNSLFSYGYTQVYELGPLLDYRTSPLPLEGADVK